MENLQPKLRFPEFKDNWKDKKLKQFSEITAGGTPSTTKNEYWGGEIPWMNSGELNLKQIFSVQGRITELGLQKSSTKLIPKYSILIGLAGQGKTRGTSAINHIELCTNQSIASILPNEKFNSFFLYYNLDYRYNELRRLSSGDGGRGGLNLSLLKNLVFNLPSLQEQTKIADFLGSVDKQLDILNQKKEKLNLYKKGVMQQLFAQQICFKDDNGNNFPEWEEKTLGEVANSFNGLTGKTAKDFGEGKKYIQYKQIFDKPYIDTNDCGLVNIQDDEKQNQCKIGDVFFTVSSETKEEIAMSSVIENSINIPLYLNSFCFGVRFNDNVLIPKFSRFYFRNESFRKSVIVLAQGSTRFNLSKVNFMKLTITIPSLEEQTKIANFLSAIDNQIEAVENQITKTETYKKGLLQQMFV